MLQDSITNLAIESSTVLLSYATQNQTSLIRYPAKQIERKKHFIQLYFDSVITHTDDLQLQIGTEIFSSNCYKISEIDHKTKSAKILCDDEHLRHLETAKPSDVSLVCDLTFLISRVRNWYQQYGSHLRFPKQLPQAAPAPSPIVPANSSHEQAVAIQGALTRPISYIWGAPGTGKTQFVLANCILSYLRQNDSARVLVLAPTNRAIEQVLYGILPHLERNDIEEKSILRMGTPTKEFAEKYPQICEDHTLNEKIEELNAYIEDALAQLEKIHTQQAKAKRFLNYRNSKAQFFDLLQPANQAHKELQEIFTQKKTLETELKDSCNSIETVSSNLQFSEECMKRTDERCAQLTRVLNRYSSPVLAKLFKTKINKLQDELFVKTAEYKKHLNIVKRSSVRLQTLKDTLTRQQEELARLKQREDENKKIIEKFIDFSISLHLIPSLLISKKSPKVFEEASANGYRLFKQKDAEYADCKLEDADFLKMQEEQLTQHIEEHRIALRNCHKSHQLRMDECRVLACTLDCCIGRIQPDGDFRPNHIFLDEAGYSPLIKTATTTAFGCPITLLGDHMQLPPVCEIDDRKIEEEAYKPVFLWAQSAIYLEDLFREDFEHLHRQYLHHHSPSFRQMPKYDLTLSFRFSSSLASILAGDVYSEKMHGSEQHHTKIYYIHVPFRPGEIREKRTNPDECKAISDYVTRHYGNDIGIITPYVNQRRLLKKTLPSITEINTVHGAQGREWDHVILSVVDTTNKWFTDSLSTISNGKKVINTAVSRARKSLIIVGDCEYWKSQPRQLLGKLLSIAEEIPPTQSERRGIENEPIEKTSKRNRLYSNSNTDADRN